MKVFAKIYNLFRGEAPKNKQDRSNNILPYGTANDFPIRITEAIYDSPIATGALNKLKKYIGGDGFSDVEFAKLIVNSNKETNDDLLKKVVEDYTYLRGFAIHVTYNQVYKIIALRHVPFETCRLTIPDKDGNVDFIAVNPFFGLADYKKAQTEHYHVFEPTKVSQQHAEENDLYKGQIFWYAETKINNRFYPVPDYYSAMNDIVADAKTGTYRERLVDNNFYQSTLIQMIGDPDEKIALNESGTSFTTVGEELDRDLRNMTGGEMAGSAMVLWSRTAESSAKITSFPNNYTDKISEAFIKQVQQNICMAVGVHPVLIGIDQSGALGQNNLLLNAIKMLQQNVNEPQREIERVFQTIYKNWNVPIDVSTITVRPLSLNVDLPDYVLANLTTEEKRKLIAKNYDVELIETADLVTQTMNSLDFSISNVPMNLSKQEIAERYNEYYSLVNMTYKELQTWSDSECCKALGYSKQAIKRNLDILNINKADWGAKEYRVAGQIINGINRLLALEPSGEVMNGDLSCGFKRDLALKNLGHKILK